LDDSSTNVCKSSEILMIIELEESGRKFTFAMGSMQISLLEFAKVNNEVAALAISIPETVCE
jgi:hypothetical protein